MVKQTTCIPVNTNRELKRIQSEGGEIINVYLVKEQGETRGAIHIIYKEPYIDSFCHSKEYGYSAFKCEKQCDKCTPRQTPERTTTDLTSYE